MRIVAFAALSRDTVFRKISINENQIVKAEKKFPKFLFITVTSLTHRPLNSAILISVERGSGRLGKLNKVQAQPRLTKPLRPSQRTSHQPTRDMRSRLIISRNNKRQKESRKNHVKQTHTHPLSFAIQNKSYHARDTKGLLHRPAESQDKRERYSVREVEERIRLIFLYPDSLFRVPLTLLQRTQTD